MGTPELSHPSHPQASIRPAPGQDRRYLPSPREASLDVSKRQGRLQLQAQRVASKSRCRASIEHRREEGQGDGDSSCCASHVLRLMAWTG